MRHHKRVKDISEIAATDNECCGSISALGESASRMFTTTATALALSAAMRISLLRMRVVESAVRLGLLKFFAVLVTGAAPTFRSGFS